MLSSRWGSSNPIPPSNTKFMFQDSKSGQTHSFGDGCGEPAHNKPEKWEEEFVRKFCNNHDKVNGIRFLRGAFFDSHDAAQQIREFIRQAISESVEEETLRWTYMTSNEREHEAERILSSIQNNAIK